MKNTDATNPEQEDALNAESLDVEFDRLAECFLTAMRNGEDVSVESFAEQHPDHAQRIRQLLPTLISLEACGRERENSPLGQEEPQDIGDYRILGLLGRGGMGVVYLAAHPQLNRTVAIKVLPKHLTNDASVLRRFRQEATAIAQMEHPNVVTLYEIGCRSADSQHEADLHYFVMQYVDGVSLDVVIRDRRSQSQIVDTVRPDQSTTRGQRIEEKTNGSSTPTFENDDTPALLKIRSELTAEPWKSIARIGIDAASGLAHAHSKEILHRDVKPSNLIIDGEGRTWVTDFGLAKLANHDATATDGLAGTLRFMAPERFRGWADPRSDIYSLGVTLYEMATLQPYITGVDRVEVINQIANSRVKPPSYFDHSIPRDLETIILKSISASPEDRYQTVDELSNDLQRFLDNRQIQARRLTPWERSRKWVQRNLLIAALATTVMLLLLAFSLGSSLAAFKFNDLANELKQEKAAATRSLMLAYIAEAHAQTSSNRPGQRLNALDAIKNAVDLLPHVQHSRDDVLQLRNEMIAALTLPDIELVREFPTPYSHSSPSPDFRYVASSGPDGTFRLFDVGTGKLKWSYQFQGGSVNASSGNCFGPNSKYVVAFSHGTGLIRLFECATGDLLLTHQSTAKRIDATQPVVFNSDGTQLVICCAGEPIKIYDLKNLSSIARKIETPQAVLRAFYFDDDTLIAYHPDRDHGRLVVHQFTTGDTRIVETRFRDAVCWSAVEDGLLVGCAGGEVARVAWPDVEQIRYARYGTPQARMLETSQAGGVFIKKSWGDDCELSDSKTGELSFSLWGSYARFSRKGNFLALGDLKTLRFYDVHSSRRFVTSTASKYTHGDHGLRLNNQGDLLLSTSGREVQLWDASSLALLDSRPVEDLWRVADFLPDGRVIAIANRRLLCFDVVRDGSGIRLGEPSELAMAFPNWLSCASAGDRIAWNSGPHSVKIGTARNLPEAIEIHLRVAATHPYFELSPNGKILAVADGTIRLFDAETAALIHDFGMETQGVPRSYFEFRPGHSEMLCHTGAEQLLIDLEQKRIRKRFPTKGYLCGAAWSRDGRILVRVIDSESITLGNADTHEELARLRLAKPLGIRTIRLNRNGDAVFAVVKKSQIHRWDLKSIQSELDSFGLGWR